MYVSHLLSTYKKQQRVNIGSYLKQTFAEQPKSMLRQFLLDRQNRITLYPNLEFLNHLNLKLEMNNDDMSKGSDYKNGLLGFCIPN